MRQRLPFDTTDQPLSLGELMDMIQGAKTSDSTCPTGILTSSWVMMLEFAEGPEEISGFLSVSSGFYPQIGVCYDALVEEWLHENYEPYEEPE